MSIFRHHQKAFSLVEVLVAITILLLVITGPMTMITRSNNGTAFATEQIAAFFLAQEGLELVQMQRDKYLLEYYDAGVVPPAPGDEPWTFFQSHFAPCDVGSGPDGCAVEIENGADPEVAVTSCATLADCRLQLDPAATPDDRPSFSHSGAGGPSLYTRVILMEYDSDRAVRVTSTVTWRTGNLISSQKVVSVTYLFNLI
jgi:prepilin-type N-terminal cleavage/methylation domain-containing protein